MDEVKMRSEITIVMNTFPKFLDKQNADHIIVFSYIKECLRVYRKCISINFLDDNTIESLSIDYYSYLTCIYSTDKEVFKKSMDYLGIVLEKVFNKLEYWELFESASNLKYVIRTLEQQAKEKNKK